MTCVYLLYDYIEYGAETIVATLSRSQLPSLLRETWPDSAECKERLATLLEQSDEELVGDKKALERGWGGVVLHVVKLTE